VQESGQARTGLPDADGAGPPDATRLLAVALVFLAAAFAVYAPALRGVFLSDDFGYIVSNSWVQSPSLANLKAILDPWGDPASYTLNWAPLHLLLHSLQWRVFGADTLGYHVTNVVLHAATSLLLGLLLRHVGLGPAAAGFGAAFFLLHPANVEAVAWISQLKTVVALLLALAALLTLPGRPAAASVLFGLALLAKAQAAFAIPVAAALVWAEPARPRWRWVAVWTLLFALYALPEFAGFQRYGELGRPLHEEVAVRLRSIVAFGARYLVMAATSFGVSAFHEPPLALWPLDPWWLLGLAAGGVLGTRAILCLARRRVEAAFWVWAAAAWAPVSQVFPFLHPMGDRYLYFILPGLLGGALLWGTTALRRLGNPAPARRLGAAALGALLLVAFGATSHARARIWRSEPSLAADAARHYPEGISASLIRARDAARQGDAAGCAAGLRAAAARGFDGFLALGSDPSYAPVRESPEFRAAAAELAGHWLERNLVNEDPTQADLRVRGLAHFARGDLDAAVAAMEAALAEGGPLDAAVREDLRRLVALRDAAARRAAPSPPG
jgi:hypothetical protein